MRYTVYSLFFLFISFNSYTQYSVECIIKVEESNNDKTFIHPYNDMDVIKKIGNMQKAVVLYKPLEKLLETLKKSGLGHLIKSVPKVKTVKKEEVW